MKKTSEATFNITTNQAGFIRVQQTAPSKGETILHLSEVEQLVKLIQQAAVDLTTSVPTPGRSRSTE